MSRTKPKLHCSRRPRKMSAGDHPLANEGVEKYYSPSKWALGLKGDSRILRHLHLSGVQNHENHLSDPVENVPYGSSERQGLNIMKCERSDDVLLFVHGGAWVRGERHMYNFISHGMHKHNMTVVNLGYTLAAEGTGLDQCVDDVVHGIERVLQLFPTCNIYLAGHSAGGHLVMAALPRLKSLHGIKRVFAVSAPYKLQPLMDSTVGVLVGFTQEQVEKFSVTAHSCYDQVQLTLVIASHDSPGLKEQAIAFSREIEEKGLQKRKVVLLPDEDHFTIIENLFYQESPLAMIFAGKYEVGEVTR